jgi:hypothetical protein
MGELQKIAVGLLGMSHPEIYRSKPMNTSQPTSGSKGTPAARALSGLKFAVAALLAGARSIPLGDNGRITRELGEYGTHLKRC